MRPLVPMRMKEQFQDMKLNIVTPIESAPIVAAASPSPTRPAIAVDMMPMRGTVMFDTMFGSAMRNIALFISSKR